MFETSWCVAGRRALKDQFAAVCSVLGTQTTQALLFICCLNSADGSPSSCRATGGLIDAGSEYEKALADEIAKLQRLYGGGDLTSFPEFKFTGECLVTLFKSLGTVASEYSVESSHMS